MTKDSYQQYKIDFKHIYQQAKLSNYPVVKVSAQNALAQEAIKAGHYDKALKWFNRSQETLKGAGMNEDGYLDEIKGKLALKA